MRQPIQSFVVVVTAFLTAVPLTAQRRMIDRSTLVITRGSEIIGNEEFVLQSGRQSAPGSGFTLTIQAHYPASRPTPVLTATIEYGANSEPVSARMDSDTGDRPSVLVSLAPQRITIRSVTPGGESARQYPAAARAMLTDEFLMSLFAVLPSDRAGAVTTIDPRTEKTEVVELADLGSGSTTVGDVAMTLRHLTLGSGEQTKHLWYDAAGRIMKLHVTNTGITATRAAEN